MYPNEIHEMQIHSSTPCKNAFQPTCRSVSLVSEAPIKKSDKVIRLLAKLPIDLLIVAPVDANCSAFSKPQNAKKFSADST